MTKVASLAAVPVGDAELSFGPEEKTLCKDLRSEIAAARSAGLSGQLFRAEQELWKLTTSIWHRDNPGAFTWLEWDDYSALVNWTHSHEYNIQTGKCEARIPTDVLKNFSGWRPYFSDLEYHAEHGLHMIVGSFEGKRALLAVWCEGGRELISYDTMRQVSELRILFQKTDKRYESFIWGFFGFFIGGIIAAISLTAIFVSSFVPHRDGPIVVFGILAMAIICAFLGAHIAKRMRNRIHVRARKDFPVAVLWV